MSLFILFASGKSRESVQSIINGSGPTMWDRSVVRSTINHRTRYKLARRRRARLDVRVFALHAARKTITLRSRLARANVNETYLPIAIRGRQQASKQARKRASKEASKQANKRANERGASGVTATTRTVHQRRFGEWSRGVLDLLPASRPNFSLAREARRHDVDHHTRTASESEREKASRSRRHAASREINKAKWSAVEANMYASRQEGNNEKKGALRKDAGGSARRATISYSVAAR